MSFFSHSRPHKRTNGRLFTAQDAGPAVLSGLRWRSAELRLLSAVAPRLAEERAALLFETPQRAATRPARPRVPGLESHNFHVSSRGEQIEIWDWGDGPTILLSHGWNGRAAQMTRFVRPLV